MDAQRVTIAERCLDAAHDGTLSFPEIVRTLTGAGFDGYAVDYRSNTVTYYQPDGSCVRLEAHAPEGEVAAAFDHAGVAAQISWAQSGSQDYSYAAFCRRMKARGCAGYIVSFPGRRVL